VVLLAEAALFRVGDWLGIGFYGMVLLTAAGFVGLSAWYFLQTRWYVFPALYLNFAYFSERFVHVQDGSYLLMLVTVLAALYLARHRQAMAHILVALAITMKLSPLYYLVNVVNMRRGIAVLFLAVVMAGLVLPIWIWENYLYIFRFNDEIKGDIWSSTGALAIAVPFALVLRYVEQRRNFDLETRIGWGLVPFALLLAYKMNVVRHLLVVLLVPDKQASRNLIAAACLALHAALPGLVLLNSTLPLATLGLIGVLVWHLREIGWDVVRADARQPIRTLRTLLAPTAVWPGPIGRP
jgi:hypothetical protein